MLAAQIVFVFASVCVQSYLLTTVSHLQSVIRDKDGVISNVKDDKLKIDNLDAMVHKLKQNSDSISEQIKTFKDNVKKDVENLKRLVHLQNTIVSNTNKNVNDMTEQMHTEMQVTNELEENFQKFLLGIGGNQTQNRNNSIEQNGFRIGNETKMVDNWMVAANFSFERMKRIEHELEKMDQITKLNSKLLQNTVINSNSQMFKNISRANASLGIMADVDTLVLEMAENLDKLKFSMPVPNSCHIYQAYGATESGNYLIDPDGVGNHQPFTAYCDFENGFTVVQHSSPESVSIPKCEGTDCYTNFLHYPTSQFQLQSLTNISSFCFQQIQFNCYSAQLKKSCIMGRYNGTCKFGR